MTLVSCKDNVTLEVVAVSDGVAVRSAKALGKELAQLRFERGYTQEELAERLGLTRQYLNQLETGAPTLVMTRLFDLIRELGSHLEVVDHHRAERADGVGSLSLEPVDVSAPAGQAACPVPGPSGGEE